MKKRKSVFKTKIFWVILLLIVLSAAFLYLFFYSPFLKVQKITIQNAERVSSSDLKNKAEELLAVKKNKFFSKNIFFIDINNIKTTILEQFPYIEKIEVSRVFPQTINIKVFERREVGIFSKDNNYFFIDKNGVIFEKIPEIISDYPIIENPTFNEDLKLGKNAINKELMEKILQIKDTLGIGIEKIFLNSSDKLVIMTKEKWEIYFHPERDIEWQLKKLKTVLEKEFSGDKRMDLKYIDLRFGDRVYYSTSSQGKN